MLKIFYMLTFLSQVQNMWADSRFFYEFKTVFDENKDLLTSAWCIAHPRLSSLVLSTAPSAAWSFAQSPLQGSQLLLHCIPLTLSQEMSTMPALSSLRLRSWALVEERRALAPWFPGIQCGLGCLMLFSSLLLLPHLSCFPQWPSLTFVKPPTPPLTNSLQHLHPDHICLA